MPTLLPDQVIGAKYRIVRLLGAGGMGAVYEVHQMDIGRRAALKLLTLDVQAQPGYFQRFVNEARSVNQISHPGVVQVYDFGIDSGQPWLVMEYLAGDSLADLIRTALGQPGRALGMDGYWIIGELASALDAAHSKGIVHRDLKPANVMIVPDPHSPTGQRVKLLDFGVAKLRDGDPLTKSGSILGTPLYMALEQFKNSADVDGKADVFALGVIAYQVLTGRLPHYGATHYEIMGSRLMNPIKPLAQLAPELPAAVSSLVMAMLEKEPAERPEMATVDLEVRRTLGLPPPRASGFHDLVAASLAAPRDMKPVGQTSDDEQPPTVDAPHGTLDLMQAQPLTPSGEKAAGELSPRGVPVPISLSSLPSVPVQIPALRAAPSDRTSAGAPEVLVAAALASPSSPTAPDRPRRAPRFLIGVALALGAAVIGTGSTLWWRMSHPPVAPMIAKPAPAATPAPVSPSKVPPAEPPREGALVAAASMAPTPAPPQPGSTEALLPDAHCEAQAPAKSCIITPQLTMHQRDLIFAAFDQSGAAFCPREPIVLSGLPSHPQIGNTPSSLRRDVALVKALRQQLNGSRFPAEVEIRCQPIDSRTAGTEVPGGSDLVGPTTVPSPPPTSKIGSRKRCQSVRATSACVPSRIVTDAQRTAIVSAMFDAGIKLCPSEHFIITMTSVDLAVRSAPGSVSRETQDVFLNSLRGRLKGPLWRGELEIRCPAP